MSEAETQKVPAWAREPFIHFLQHIKDAHSFYHLSMDGLLMIIHRSHRIEELTAELERLDRESGWRQSEECRNDEVRQTAKKEAELAKAEVDRGFPLLNEQAVVDLWGAVESLVRTLLTSWLANQTASTQVDAVRKVKIRLVDYEVMTADERFDYLIDEMERDLGAPFKQGANRFEALLDVFGLSGNVDKQIQKDLFELSQVRNVIVHRRGVADRKMVEACPWVAAKVGDRITITSDAYHRYLDAAVGYMDVLLGRLRNYFGAVQNRAVMSGDH